MIQVSSMGSNLMMGKMDFQPETMLSRKLADSLSLSFRGKTPIRAADTHDSNTTDADADVSESAIAHDENETAEESEWEEAENEALVEVDEELDAEIESSSVNSAEANIEQLPSHSSDELEDSDIVSEASPVKPQDQHKSTLAPSTGSIRIDLPESGLQKPSFYWTWRLLADGYSSGHIEQVREIEMSTIIEHTIQAAENNLPIQADWLLSPAEINRLQQFEDENADFDQISLISKLPNGISAQQFIYFMKCTRK